MKQKTRRRPVRAAPAVELIPPETPPARGNWRRHGWRILVIWAIVLAAYSNSFRAGLVLDNSTLIGEDTRIRTVTPENLHLILSEELWYHHATTGAYRPLTTFSYLVNYAVFHNGARPAGYHWVNFGLHAANILLVYLLGLLVFGEATPAWALAALWGLHPLVTESVTNLVGRADLLAAFGVLAGLLCHVQAARAGGWRRRAWLAALALAAGVGLFSKESAVVLPGVMLLHDLTWPPARWKSRWPGYAAVAVPFAVFFKLRADMLARQFVGLIPFLDNPLMDAGFWTARLTAIKVIGEYLRLFVWPARLSPDYSYNAVPLFGWRLGAWEDLTAILALLVCIAAAALAIRMYGAAKPIFFFIFFFFITLAPVSNVFLVIGSIMAERFVYLPMVGLTGCVVLAFQAAGRRLAPRWPAARPLGWALAILICAAYTGRSFVRNLDWIDDRTLAASAVRTVPQSFKAHYMLAHDLLNARPPELDGAVREIDRMMAILGGLPARLSTARIYELAAAGYRMKGDSLSTDGEPSPASNPSRAFWYRKALAALSQGEAVDRAENEEIRRVNRAHGKEVAATAWIPLYLELGRVYRRLGEPRKALDALADGRSRRADDEFSEEMSRTRLGMGDADQAAVALLEGLVLNPGSASLPADLVELYRQTARDSCALSASSATRINLQCPMVHNQLCTASRNVALSYARAGQTAKAAATARSAIQNLACPAPLFR